MILYNDLETISSLYNNVEPEQSRETALQSEEG